MKGVWLVTALCGALSLLGCLGPELRLPPPEPRGVHERACAWLVCPRAAQVVEGTVDSWRYDRARHKCECYLRDRARVPVRVERDPHNARNR